MQYDWNWFTGFWLADGSITRTTINRPNMKQHKIMLSQNSGKLIEEIKTWLESQGYHVNKYTKRNGRHTVLSIYRHKEVVKLAKILLKRTPKWHYKAHRLEQAIKDLKEKMAINELHAHQRDNLGTFTLEHKWTPYTLEGREKEFTQMYLDKKISLKEICKRLGIGGTTIHRTRDRLHLPHRIKVTPKRPLTPSECKEIGKLYNSGIPLKEMEKRTGRHRDTIYRALKKLRIRPNRDTTFKKGNYPARWLKRS